MHLRERRGDASVLHRRPEDSQSGRVRRWLAELREEGRVRDVEQMRR